MKSFRRIRWRRDGRKSILRAYAGDFTSLRADSLPPELRVRRCSKHFSPKAANTNRLLCWREISRKRNGRDFPYQTIRSLPPKNTSSPAGRGWANSFPKQSAAAFAKPDKMSFTLERRLEMIVTVKIRFRFGAIIERVLLTVAA